MMKRTYVEPSMEMEQFVANECVAACRVCEKSSKFCWDYNGNGKWDTTDKKNEQLGGKHKSHVVGKNAISDNVVVCNDHDDISDQLAFYQDGLNPIITGYYFLDVTGGYHFTTTTAATNASN